MAVYKVIQDIEAEDKLLGPLTVKGFIYFAIAAVLMFISFRVFVSGGPIYVRLAVVLVLFFPMALFGVLASPLGRDQPTEVWLLSHIRFLLKPRVRNWDQAGLDEMVTVTAPKRQELHLTKEFSQTEVQSRLRALATTLDSRGWAVKNSAVDLSPESGYLGDDNGASDRLIAPSAVAQPSQVVDVRPSDDILDEQNNATAQHFNELMQVAETERKQAIIKKVDEARQDSRPASGDEDTRFLDSSTRSGNTIFVGRTVVTPHDDDSSNEDSTNTAGDESLPPAAQAVIERERKRAEDIHRRSASFKRSKSSRNAAKRASDAAAAQKIKEDKARQDAVTAAQAAAKLELAQSGNDLSVASVAHLASRAGQVRQIGPGEVEISLH